MHPWKERTQRKKIPLMCEKADLRTLQQHREPWSGNLRLAKNSQRQCLICKALRRVKVLGRYYSRRQEMIDITECDSKNVNLRNRIQEQTSLSFHVKVCVC